MPSTQTIEDDEADPFHERGQLSFSRTYTVLGARFRFDGTSEALLALVDAAYAGLPAQEPDADSETFRIELRLVASQGRPYDDPPPRVRTESGGGVLCGIVDASNYVVMIPAQRWALVVVSGDMLVHAYHVRYELIEFAVFVLAARGLGRVPLHGACIGTDGRGVLLLGRSGAGKSTLALASYADGMTLLAEDAVFVHPATLAATGVGNFVHVKEDGLRFLDDDRVRRWIARSPVIRRRSGVVKFEADLRLGPVALSPVPMRLAAIVLVCGETVAEGEKLLEPVACSDVAACLAGDQPYASGQPGWHAFVAQASRLGMYRLRRGRHPQDGVDALRGLLGLPRPVDA